MATPNMSLDLPTPTVTLGPAWATQLNNALELVDTHDHSTGNGVRVKPDGLNINSDLDIQTNNLNSVLSMRMATQPSIPVGASDIQSLYSFSGNLYYNNENGDSIRITLGTSIDASAVGGIGGDYGTTPASVTYVDVSKTYEFETDTNQQGALDVGAVTIRETDVVNSNGVALTAPAGLAADYTMTLPGAVPASTQLLTMSASGVLDFADTDETSLETTGAGVLQVKDLGIITAKLNNLSVTTGKLDSEAVTTAKIAALAVTTGNIADNAVDKDKVNIGTASVAISTGVASAAITLPQDLVDLTISFDGVDSMIRGNGAGAVAVTYTWTGPGGTISSGEISNQFGTVATLLPASILNLKVPGTATAGVYTLTLSGGMTFRGGNIRYYGVA